jgi:hypothetical protein
MRCPVCDHEQVVGPECDVCGKRLGPSAAPSPAVTSLGALEATRLPGAAVPVEALPELTADRAPEADPRPSGPVPCRYCQHLQAAGKVCERCGMRLPTAVFAAPAVAPARRAEPEVARCRSCGTLAKAGPRCTECGSPIPRVDG